LSAPLSESAPEAAYDPDEPQVPFKSGVFCRNVECTGTYVPMSLDVTTEE
jgi:hypothetical protein